MPDASSRKPARRYRVLILLLLIVGGGLSMIALNSGTMLPLIDRLMSGSPPEAPAQAAAAATAMSAIAPVRDAAAGFLAAWWLWALILIGIWLAWRAFTGANGEDNRRRFGEAMDMLRPAAGGLRRAARNKGHVGLAVLAALLISLVSFYTTFKGAMVFFGTQPDQFAMAFLLAFGIQATAYLASWMVAEEMVTGERSGNVPAEASWLPMGRLWLALAAATLLLWALLPPGITLWRYVGYMMLVVLTVFTVVLFVLAPRGRFMDRHAGKVLALLICVFASVFFSFAAHFENVYGPKRLALANQQNARADTQGVLVSAEKAIIAERDAVSAALTGGAPWTIFNTAMNTMLTLAENNPQVVQGQIRARRAAAEGELARTRAELEAKRKELAGVQGDIDRLRALGGAPAAPGAAPEARRIADLAAAVDELKQRRADYDAALQIELGKLPQALGGNRPENVPDACRALAQQQAARRGGRTGRGEGPVSRCIRSELNDVQIRLGSQDAELQRLKRENTGRLQASANREQQVRLAEARRVTLAGEVAALASRESEEMKALNVVDSSTDLAQAASGEENSKRLRAERDAFLRTGSKTHFDTMIAGCASLQEILRTVAATQSQVPAGVCDPSGFAATVDRMTTLDRALTEFRQTCAIDTSFNRLPDAMAYVDKGNSCLAVAKVPDRLVAEQATISRIAQLNHPDASNFERSIGSLDRGDKLAWLSMALAIAVDLIVFLSAVIGEGADRSPMLRAEEDTDVRTKKDVEDVRAGAADLNVYGDEPHAVLVHKTLVRNIRTRYQSANEAPRLEVDLSGIDDERTVEVLRGYINALAVKKLASAMAGERERYDLKKSVLVDSYRLVADWERMRAETERPRPARAWRTIAAGLRRPQAAAAPEPPARPAVMPAPRPAAAPAAPAASATPAEEPPRNRPSDPAAMGEHPRPDNDGEADASVVQFPGRRGGIG